MPYQGDDNEHTFQLLAIFMPASSSSATSPPAWSHGGYRVLNGEMTIGTLTAFLLYLRMFFEPMQEISQFFNTFQSASSALEKLAGVLAERPAIMDAEHPVTLTDVGEIAFRDVRFEYVAGRPVLPDLDFTVRAGQTVALVGTTGAGKTTIAKLIARFYTRRPVRSLWMTSTCATFRRSNCADTSRWHPGELHVRRDNIRVRPTGGHRRGGRRRGEAVGADRFIAALPTGHDVAKRVAGSRRQRQLVAFARAFLADPAVLILDEATSSLDIPSERMVQRALMRCSPTGPRWHRAPIVDVQIADRVPSSSTAGSSRTVRPPTWSPATTATTPHCTGVGQSLA